MKAIEKVRTFFEVRISEKVHRNINELLVKLHPEFEKNNWKVKWVHPDNVHITLRFLGDIDPPLINILKENFSKFSSRAPFKITIKGFGAFPSYGSPRIIWVGIEDPDGSLKSLASQINEKLKEFGFKPEKREFRPHITVGRVAHRGSKPLVDLIENYSDETFGQMEVKEFLFMKSKLTSERAIHTPLWNVVFREKGEN